MRWDTNAAGLAIDALMTSAHQPDTTKGGLQLNAAYLKCMISILMSMSKSFQSQSTMTRIFHHLGRLLPDAVGVHIEWLTATLCGLMTYRNHPSASCFIAAVRP